MKIRAGLHRVPLASLPLLAPMFLAAALLGSACKVGGTKVTPAEAPSTEPSLPTASMVDVSAVVGHCPDDPKMASRQAELAIRKLVAPCLEGTGGDNPHFTATLLPGGKIELVPDASTDGGAVPACAQKKQVTHLVKLKSACSFEVRIEERKVPAVPGRSADAG